MDLVIWQHQSREYTPPRPHQDSFCGQALGKRHTVIGPVLEVKTLCHLHVHGIEIQISSTSGDNTNVWVVISRGSNRYVDELRCKDPEYSPGSFEEADYGSMQETDAEQPTIQPRPQSNSSVDFIPTKERNWEDITANEYCHKYEWDTISQILFANWYDTKITMTESRWRSLKLKLAFLKHGGDTSSDSDWINHIWKGSSKTPFQCCQNSCNTSLYIRAFQGHTGGKLIEPELMGHVAFPFNWIFLVRRGCSFNLKSILEAGLITGWKECREGRQTVFLHSPGSLGRWDWRKNPRWHVETKKGALQHWVETRARRRLWIHLAKAQEKDVTLWQTRSHAIIAYKTVPPDCIEEWYLRKVRRLHINDSLTKASSKHNSQKCMESAAAAARTKVMTTVSRRLRETAAKTML